VKVAQHGLEIGYRVLAPELDHASLTRPKDFGVNCCVRPRRCFLALQESIKRRQDPLAFVAGIGDRLKRKHGSFPSAIWPPMQAAGHAVLGRMTILSDGSAFVARFAPVPAFHPLVGLQAVADRQVCGPRRTEPLSLP